MIKNNNSRYNSSYSLDINSFYENLSNTSFKGLDSKRILILKVFSKQLNEFYNNNAIRLNKVGRYVKIMNRIKSNPKGYGVSSDAERYLLFMFSVDPNLEAAKIHGECDRINDAKTKMKMHFGLYDRKLILLENYFIKHFLSEEKRKEINEEIERSAFK